MSMSEGKSRYDQLIRGLQPDHAQRGIVITSPHSSLPETSSTDGENQEERWSARSENTTAKPFAHWFNHKLPAQVRILFWLSLTTCLGMGLLIVMVTAVLQAQAAGNANDKILHELNEFNQLLKLGNDPLTGQPFASIDRAIVVYNNRQQSEPGEYQFGMTDQSFRLHERRGPSTPTLLEYNIQEDANAMEQIANTNSGVLPTPAGEFRWGKLNVVDTAGHKGFLVVGIYTKVYYDTVTAVQNLMILIAIGVIIVVLAIGWVVASYILLPLRNMRITAAEVSHDELTKRIPIQSDDDLGELARTFNDMLDRLEIAFATQQRFIADAGHELRTPITIVRGQLELLSNDPAERAQTIALVINELDRMSRIVSDLLILAQSERPDFIQLDSNVDISMLTLDLDTKLQTIAPRQWSIGAIAEGNADIDTQRITQAVVQLAQNAVDHTQDGDAMTLSTSFATDSEGQPVLIVSLTDSGAGVAQSEIATLFSRFARGTSKRHSGQRSGAGLGLSIVQAIADGHNGSAFADSVAGQGATFGLIVPRWQSAPKRAVELAHASPNGNNHGF